MIDPQTAFVRHMRMNNKEKASFVDLICKDGYTRAEL